MAHGNKNPAGKSIHTGHRQRVLEEIQELQRHLEKIEHKIQRLKQAEGR